MRVLKTISLFVLISSISLVFAQEQSEIEHTIDSKIFWKERIVKVFLPNSYATDSTATYPVTYVLDGQHKVFWDSVKGNIGYLSYNYSIMPMIVVGVVSDNRGSEFNPENKELQEHLQKEVFPLIQANYRTDGFRSVIGHSWGGAFVGNTLFSDKRDMFDAYIGISPSFGDTDNVIVKHADSLLKLNTNFGKYLYLSHGDVGRREVEFKGYVNTIDSLLKKYPNKTIAWQPRRIERVGHWQIVGPSICDGLISMSRNYFADQKVIEDMIKTSNGNLKQRISDFYAEKKAIFGYAHEASAGYLNFVANDIRDLENYKGAIEVYNLALDKKPNNVRVYVNICDLYDKMGDKIKAKELFTQTQKLLESQKSEVSDNYYKNVSEWIQEKLDGYN
ncbi:alpha/beta hydrolase-fold protein [Winogradskyella sp. PG-2]|uniref:alpha/beta hydrolase-fold protein n=1 Tax=Winogradskyella sp. PG-2 TaxID=754409 RepID=UPI00045867B0|nr:alpha/beta hydrolase-fold protein [Winogradskyella sp. PG-2]BAO77614.1 putative esterase [Winogradskyella sp. PG-2]